MGAIHKKSTIEFVYKIIENNGDSVLPGTVNPNF